MRPARTCRRPTSSRGSRARTPLIGQAVAIGDRRPYNVALIVLDPDACAAFAREHGLRRRLTGRARGRRAGAADGRRRRSTRRTRTSRASSRSSASRSSPTEWEPGGEELTPTMKLKRRPIAEQVRGRDRSALRVAASEPRPGARRDSAGDDRVRVRTGEGPTRAGGQRGRRHLRSSRRPARRPRERHALRRHLQGDARGGAPHASGAHAG